MPGMLGDLRSNYYECTFSLRLPTLTIYEDRVDLNTGIFRKQNTSESIVVDYCSFTAKNNVCFAVDPSDMLLPAVGMNAGIRLSIDIPRKGFLYSGARLSIGLLTQNGQRIEASFICDGMGKTQFEGVRTGKMAADDEQRFMLVVSAYNKKLKKVLPEEKPRPVHNAPTEISDYIKALAEEKSHLKHNGGRSYKVTSGRRISISGGRYSYIFDLETEMYLSDDAPIKVTTGGSTTTGNVLVCDGFRITVILESDLGVRVNVAHITVEPWRLLESLSDRLQSLSKSDKIAMMLLEQGPRLSEKKPLSAIATGQKTARNRAVNEPITVIWGPPGTGKTHTMAEIAIDSIAKGKSVLVVSHSNISVDGVVLKVSELLHRNNMQKALADGRVLRYGYVRDEKLAQNQNATSFNYALNRSPSLRAKMDELNKKRDQLKTVQYSEEHVRIEQEVKKIRSLLHDEEIRYVNGAQLVATTISKVYADRLFDDKKYDVVMFDEVSMAYVPQILCAAMFARQSLVCVGDFRQLAPISQSKARTILEKDLFSFLRISDYEGHIYYHPWLVLLNEQRRMHPCISAFPNREFYHGLLKDHESIQGARDAIVKRLPFRNHPISLVDLTGTYCAAGKNSDNSRYNILSAITTIALALQAEQSGEDSIGIITPYAAQTRLIRAMLLDHQKEHKTSIACSTVHQFQGSERNIICFDAVESYPSKKLGILMSKNDNNSVTRLINVAVTRARGKLILVANRGFWTKKFEGTKNALYLLVLHLMKHGNMVDTKNQGLAKVYTETRIGNTIRLFVSANESASFIEKDIEQAKKRIMLVLPDSRLDTDNVNRIWNAVRAAKQRGIEIEIKAREVNNLPEAWKTQTVISEKAIFPLIMIDDKTVWYGYPMSSCFFSDGSSGGYATIMPVIARIKGEHTIELIRSLSEIEQGGNEVADENEVGIASAGFRRFVNEKEFCPLCKEPYMLARGQSGKHYLKCSNKHCKSTKPVDPKLVEWYLNQKQVRCPKHKCDLTVRTGLYGVYVHCSHDHNFKLSEI